MNCKEKLKEQIRGLKDSEVHEEINKRIKEFKELKKRGNEDWFDELCFCILTANSSADMGIKIQNYMKNRKGFQDFSESEIRDVLKDQGYRFYNRRAEYISLAQRYKDNLKDKLTSLNDSFEKREWIVDNVKGIGYKEGSHFLRNVGYLDLAILDRHILRCMEKNEFIEIPKTLTEKRYLDIEKKFNKFSEEIDLMPGKLDLFLWYMETGEIKK
ncbi:MAG: N-glycosylase/DNA lyase [archaeon]